MFRQVFDRIVRVFAAALALAMLAGGAATCRAQVEIQSARTIETERAVRAALERPMSFNFVDAPLKDVVASFQRSLGVPVVLDVKGLTDAGVTGDTPITFVESAVSARMALDTILATKDLNWIVERDLLVITTADVAKSRTVVRVYPVADLVFIESADAYDADFDSLIEVITSIVNPSSWDSNGGAGSIAPFVASGALVVDQTREVQEQIESLLERLREVRDQQGLRNALKIVGARAESADQSSSGGAFAVEETAADISPPPSSKATAAPARWRIPRVYH